MCERIGYNYGASTPDLDVFILNYQRALSYEIDTRASLNRLLYDMKKMELGDDGLATVIETKMGEDDFVLLENDFPYNNLIPGGSMLRHFCLWSKNEERLTAPAINEQIETKFPNKPAYIFRHGGNFISIRKIPHVHIIVDFKS